MSYNTTIPQLPDPNTTPAGPGFVSVSLTDNSPGIMHSLNTGASVSVKYAGNYWTINISYPQLTIEEGTTLSSFLYGLGGQFTNFYVSLPIHDYPNSGPIGTGLDTYSIAATKGNTANTITSTSSDCNNLAPGDLFKLGSSPKIYMINGIVNDGGTYTITTNSDIITDSGGIIGAIYPNDVKFKVRLTSNSPAFVINSDGLYEAISLTLRENIFEG